ncbi:MAG TPA: hypothetical protein VD699_06675 [Nitrosopumilaceae archaeon]|nr:hypothetical protein [Nitrosopumilaceae archaeon]
MKVTDHWLGFSKEEMLEILACMEDSDRYIFEGQKDRLIRELKSKVYGTPLQNKEKVNYWHHVE